MKVKVWALLLITLLVLSVGVAGKSKVQPPLVQMAILLDTSGSMEGLIEQAKTQLWKIVNELATARKNGQVPRLEVALYEYGKSTIPATEGYLRMIVPLSQDLDRISEELFKLKTNGGDEYCGQVIQAAVEGLNWSTNNNELKVIFIAGNEPFTQGQVDYKVSCKSSVTKGIIVNTIHCGDYETGVRTNWKDGADLADGKYMNIDHNQKIAHIAAPQDKEIIELSTALNKTYVAYGGRIGKAKKERQEKQDSNAMAVSEEVMVQRAAAKSSAQYSNVSWDLVDAEKEGKVKIEDVKDEDLPEEMRKMSKEERKNYIEKKQTERAKIQEKIKKLKSDRDNYVAEKRKTLSKDKTLDSAIIGAIREQAEKKKYEFEKK